MVGNQPFFVSKMDTLPFRRLLSSAAPSSLHAFSLMLSSVLYVCWVAISSSSSFHTISSSSVCRDSEKSTRREEGIVVSCVRVGMTSVAAEVVGFLNLEGRFDGWNGLVVVRIPSLPTMGSISVSFPSPTPSCENK